MNKGQPLSLEGMLPAGMTLDDVLIFTGSGATKAQFVVSYVNQPGIGLATIAEAVVTYKPTGQVLWTVTDGDALNDLILRIGSINYDLI